MHYHHIILVLYIIHSYQVKTVFVNVVPVLYALAVINMPIKLYNILDENKEYIYVVKSSHTPSILTVCKWNHRLYGIYMQYALAALVTKLLNKNTCY